MSHFQFCPSIPILTDLFIVHCKVFKSPTPISLSKQIGVTMAGEAMSRLLVPSPSNSRFASLMATATQSESERAQKLARLQAQQQLEANRRNERELAEKERKKHDRWNK